MPSKFRDNFFGHCTHAPEFPIIETHSQGKIPIKEIEQDFVFRKAPQYMSKVKYPWLAKRLGERNNADGLPTRADLARYLGVQPSYITKIFSGERQIQRGEEERLAQFFGISMEEVLTGKPAKKVEISDAEVALTDALKVLMQVFLHNGMANPRSFMTAFSSMEADYHKKGLPGAVLVMQQLVAFAAGGEPRPEKELIERLLQLPPLGRA